MNDTRNFSNFQCHIIYFFYIVFFSYFFYISYNIKGYS